MTTFPHFQRQIEDLAMQLEGAVEFLEAIGGEALADKLRIAQRMTEEVSRDVKQGVPTA